VAKASEHNDVAMSRSEEDAIGILCAKGATIAQIARLFGTTAYLAGQALADLAPIGSRRGSPVYLIKDAAPYLIKAPIDKEEIERAILAMKPVDLPKQLQKEFWGALRARQAYRREAGDLWPTTKVIEHVGDLYKLVAMSARLTSDAVERQIELTEAQRKLIKDQMNGMLKNLEHSIKDKFSAPEGDVAPDDEDDDKTI
jgi:hypothetical protein